jgi:antitoxin (DNA-binding transcriptional repressor) of toxin-antitoxin stability system
MNDTINAKEIRQDLEGFLRRVKTGKPITVIYRSKPYVTINAPSNHLTNERPGSALSVKRSIATAKLLRSSSNNNINSQYHDLLEQKYGKI